MAQRDAAKQQPIGYWLKRADQVITEHANKVLHDNGFTRVRWQVLNTIYQVGTITRSGVFETMRTFIDARHLGELIDGFVEEGWLLERGEGDAAQLTLTEAGKDKREALFELQSEVRSRAVRGITEQEYTTVIDVLQRVVKNLERARNTGSRIPGMNYSGSLPGERHAPALSSEIRTPMTPTKG